MTTTEPIELMSDEELITALMIEVASNACSGGLFNLYPFLRKGLSERMADQRLALDRTYHERNQVVAALAKCFPSGLKKTKIEGWDPEWHNCVYIELPSGQVSWHFHDEDMPLFKGLPPYGKEWDGHSTPEKYRRLAALGAVNRRAIGHEIIDALWPILGGDQQDDELWIRVCKALASVLIVRPDLPEAHKAALMDATVAKWRETLSPKPSPEETK